MNHYRIHILGASGSGTTTLGKQLSKMLDIPHYDTDDYYWEPTDPPYERSRAINDRLKLMEHDFLQKDSWVLSGSLCKWGDSLIQRFTHVIFTILDPQIRIQRLKAREFERYGNVILPEGCRYDHYIKFLEWAESYDNAQPPTRSRRMHELWLKTIQCQVMRVNTEQSVEKAAEYVIQVMR